MRLIVFLLVLGVIVSAGAAHVFLGGLAEDEDDRILREHRERAAVLINPAEQGDAESQYQLADHFLNTHALTVNETEAVRWYRQAASNGHAMAQFVLGQLYEQGQGVRQSYDEAARWYERSAVSGGNAEAQYALGQFYFKGLGVGSDRKKATAWFRRAADGGQPVAQFLLGRMFESGWGVRADPIEAYKWYALAERQRERVLAEHLDYDPTSARERMAAGMNSSQRRLARDGISEWLKQNE